MWPQDGIIPDEWKDRYVFLDLEAGQMVLAYPTRLARGDARNYPLPFRIERFDLNSQVDASLSARFRHGNRDRFIYEYEVLNSSDAKKGIDTLRIPTRIFGPDDVMIAPASWRAVPSPSSINAIRLSVGRSTGVFLVWYEFGSDSAAILPGTKLKGFSVESRLLPGIIIAYVQGGEFPNLRGDMPEAVLAQSDPILQIEFNSQNIVTIGPKFEPETPKSIILEDFRRGIGLLVDANRIRQDSPSVRHVIEVLEPCLAGSEETAIRIQDGCDLEFAFSISPMPGVESEVLQAMQLSMAE